jgi:hypothetical protein
VFDPFRFKSDDDDVAGNEMIDLLVVLDVGERYDDDEVESVVDEKYAS